MAVAAVVSGEEYGWLTRILRRALTLRIDIPLGESFSYQNRF